MESDADMAARQLSELEVRRLEVYAAGSTPHWAWSVLGAGVGLFVASFSLRNPVVNAAAAAAYTVFIAVWVAAVIRRTGVQSRFGHMPAPLRRVLYWGWFSGAVAAGAAVAIGLAFSYAAGGILAGIVFALGGRRYAAVFQRRAAGLVAAARTT